MDINFIDLSNMDSADMVEGVIVRPLKRARRGDFDPRGYLVEMSRSDWLDEKYDTNPPAMTYSSFTYTGVTRDEDMWHVHPAEGVEGGIEQIDRWSFIGKAIAVVADPQTKRVNLFKIGTGWGDAGFYNLMIPPRMYHGFLSVGGVIDDEGKDGVWILNWPDKLYNYDNPKLVEGRVPFAGSQVKLPSGNEFNWSEVRSALGLKTDE